MKKLLRIFIVLFIFSILSLSDAKVSASEGDCFTVVGSSDSKYWVELQLRSIKSPKVNTAYVGQKLSDFTTLGQIVTDTKKSNCLLKWDNPDYIIVDGKQTVTATVGIITYNDRTTFTIEINPISEAYEDISCSAEGVKRMLTGFEGLTLEQIVPPLTVTNGLGETVKGIMTYSDYNLSVGLHDIKWTFTPDEKKYKSKSGIYHINITPKLPEVSEEELEEDTTLALTASTLTLSENSTYDINIDNKVSNSTYAWTSSNTKTVKVSKSGLVSALNEGTTEVTCKITTPDDEVTILSADVTVGTDDDNLPVLSESDLSLEIGDLVDVNVENKIVSCKYKWTSSDKTIAKVTSTSGKITGLSDGNATIYCTITAADKTIIVLKCEVEVSK